MASLTLNQIIKRIRTLALSHHQINNFYFGDVPEFDANGEINYPACFLEAQPGTIDRTTHLQTFNFRIYLCDLVKVSNGTEENETDVLSDMSSVAADICAMLMFSEYEQDWEINTGTIAPFTESLNDLVAGVVMDVSIGVLFDANRCQVPAEDVEFENDFDMARTRILSHEGVLSDGDSFTVDDLAGKIVLAVYRAGMYKRAITTTPTDTERVGVAGTDLGSRKGIQSSTGVVELIDGDALNDGEILDFLIWE